MKSILNASVAAARHNINALWLAIALVMLVGCERETAKPAASSTPAAPTQPPKSEAASQVERLLIAGKFQEADKLVDEYAPGQSDANWEFLRMAARAKLNVGNPTAALSYAEKALALQPRDTESKVVMGVALVRTGQAVRGEKLLSEMASRFSREVNFQCQLAEARSLAGKLPEAERAARDAVKYAPDDVGQAPLVARAHQTLGVVLIAQQRYPEAIAELRAAIEFYKYSAGSQYSLSVALARSGKLEEARAAAAQATVLNPGNAIFAAQLGAILLEQKQGVAASAALEKAVQLDPNLKSAWTSLANAARLSGNSARAKAAEEKAKSLPADSPEGVKFQY
jgi:tetratricopeptide (TPR) repeat protein